MDYDLVVIGGGPGGYVAAIRAAQLGFHVACIEKRKTLGGTCLNVGCIPTKALLDSTGAYYFAKTKFKKHGILAENLSFDLTQMMKRKDSVVRQLTRGVAGLFSGNKIDYICGAGKLLDVARETKIIEVKYDGASRKLEAKNIILATGSVPSDLRALPVDGKNIIDSTEALALDAVPEHLVVIGAGVIGLELGSVWMRLGAKVTFIEYEDKILSGVDNEMALELKKILHAQGMEFLLAHECVGAEVAESSVVAKIKNRDTREIKNISASKILVATGRKPFVSGLGLESAKIKLDDKGRITITDSFQTNVPGVFAIGDIVRGPMLAHKAEEEGLAVAEIIAGQSPHINYDLIPGVIYTHPEFASVGKTEEDLKQIGCEYKIGKFPFVANGRAKALDELDGFVKVLSDTSTDKILGIHILGPQASELVAEAVLALASNKTSADIGNLCHAHPTLSEVIKEAALSAVRRAIHI